MKKEQKKFQKKKEKILKKNYNNKIKNQNN